MKNVFSTVKNEMISRYLTEDDIKIDTKSTDINVLLNRVKLDQKKESRKKILFSIAASFGVLLFGALVF